jgi:hypothetical protein
MRPKTTKTAIKNLLKQSEFDPREKNPVSVVVNLDAPDYSEMKAIELIHEARQIQIDITKGLKKDVRFNTEEYHEKLTMAISLLALARSQRGPAQSKKEA